MSNTLTREAMEELTKEELVKFGNLMYGLNVNKNFAKKELIDMIASAQQKYKGNEEIRVVEGDDTERVKPGFIKVRVQPGRYNPNNRPIFVSHNFRPATIPVNVDVIIPEYYENCLKDAVQDRYFKDTEGEFQHVKEQAYPYSVLERG